MEGEEIKSQGKPCSGWKFQCTRLYSYIALLILYALVSFHKQCTSVLSKKISATYEVEENKISVFSAIYFYPYACTQPFAGLFADLLDPAIVVGVFSCIASVGSIICAASSSLGVGIFGRFLVGLGCGPTYVSTCRVITNWFKLQHLSIYMGILVAVSGLGGILAALPLALFADKYGWKAALYGIGGIGGVLSIFILIFVRGSPTSKGYEPVNSQLATSGEPMPFKEKMVLLWTNFKTVLAYGYFWVITVFNATSSAPYFNVAGYWGGPYLTAVLGYDSKKKGTTLISCSVGVIAGSLILPHLSNLLHTKKWILVAADALALASIIPLMIHGENISNGAIWAIYTIIGFFTAPCISISYPLLCSYYHPKVAGSSVGLGNFFIFMAAAIYQQISTLGFRQKDENGKAIQDWYGYKWGLWFFCIVSLAISLIAAILAKETKAPTEDSKELDNSKNMPEMKKEGSSDVGEDSEGIEDSGSGVEV